MFGIDRDNNAPFEESADPELRNRESLVAKLKNLSLVSRPPWSVKCFCGNATEIGTKNITEITKAIFRSDRKKCPRFSQYDKYATPLAVKERDDLRLEKIDKRISLIISILSLIFSILLPLILA
jgi:hypothetical protein